MARIATQRLHTWLLCTAMAAGLASSASSALAQAPAPPLQPLPHPELPELPPVPAEVALWVWIVTAVLCLGMLGLILWFLLRPRRFRAVTLSNPRQETLRALRQLQGIAATLEPSEVGHRVSTLLRQYLLTRYHIPAPFRTTPELFSRSTPALTPQTTNLLELRTGLASTPSAPVAHFAPLAELWDRLSFAPVPATSAEALALVDSALKRIEEDPA
jgi:hypothetical protein